MFFAGLLNDSQRSDRYESTFPSNGDTDILLGGYHDENFYKNLELSFRSRLRQKKFTRFVQAGGKEELRQTRKF